MSTPSTKKPSGRKCVVVDTPMLQGIIEDAVLSAWDVVRMGHS